jgi:hypothetical protein
MKLPFTTTFLATAFALSPLAALPASAAIYEFDVTDIFSNDEFGDPINEVYFLNVGSSAEIIGIGWDVTIFADAPSWLSEMEVHFGNTTTESLVVLAVSGEDVPGFGSYSSGGIVDLVDLGLQFSVGADGLLRLEFAESFDDFLDDWDGIWQSGTITIQTAGAGVIPEPATWAMMIVGFGLVGHASRRRRSSFAKA